MTATPTGSHLERLALDYHKTVEGEYGCPGLTCPGVQRLIQVLTQIKGIGQREDVAQPVAQLVAQPYSTWHEDDGAAIWWRFPIGEGPYVGTPLDDDWPVP